MIRRLTRSLAVVAWLAALLPGICVAANPPPPTDLKVDDGREQWQPTNDFWLGWHNPAPAEPGPAIVAAHYRVLDRLGTVVERTRLGWAAYSIDDLRVPGPGVYTVEVWLEDSAGNQGNPATAQLRFDDTRPRYASARQPTGWIGRTDFPYAIRIDRPADPAPVSGIRGYAFSTDRSPRDVPCAGPTLCTDAETDLRGGAEDNLLSIPELAEGTTYLHTVAVSGSGMRSATVGETMLRIDKTDPLTHLTGASSGWSNHPIALVASATDAAAGMSEGGAFTAIQVDGGAPALAAGDLVRTSVIGEGTHRIAYYARDAAGNVNDGAFHNGHPGHPPATATVRIDRGKPEVAFLDAQDHTNPELVEARVVDPLSGPSSARGWIALRRAGSGDPFQRLPTRAAADARLRAHWDSEAFPIGTYEFQATGYDTAGNATTTVLRSNGTAMTLSNPVKETTTLRGGFDLGSPRRRLVAYGRGTGLHGRLTTGMGTPLEGIDVQIAERFAGGADPAERVSTAKTGRGGAFSVHLGAGPSREVIAAFGGSRTLASSATPPVQLAVRSKVSLRVSAAVAAVGGRPVIFSGRVIAANGTIPEGGKSVALQFRVPGLPWTEFRTIQTDRRGRFRYPYRFTDDDSRGIRFHFRAYAPAQGDWPYEPGGSRPVAVRGS